ncbi:MAG: YebC/PmpR family DNA-binding transcriptional regulator [Phycisphaerales bacterium]
MAGHNKWSKIKHRKAVVDKRRGKVWTKVSKAIIVAAKNGGPDPDSNLSLRYAIDEARYANMPRDTIERAIKKGAGGEDQSNYETVRYEGYGPGGVAVIIDTLTDNRARTVGDLRLAFSDHSGNLGTTGCVGYLFQPRGVIVVETPGKTEDQMMELALEINAADAQSSGDEDHPQWTIITSVEDFNAAKAAIDKSDLKITEANLAMVPDSTVEIRGENAQTLINLIDAIEDLDDVQKVYSNAFVPDDEIRE